MDLAGGICIFVALVSDTSVFFLFTLGFLAFVSRLVAVYVGRWRLRDPGSPVFYSAFVFPIYSYDPATNDLVDENKAGAAIYGSLGLVLCWGVLTTVRWRVWQGRGGGLLSCCPTATPHHSTTLPTQTFVDPVGVGVAITSTVLVTTVVLSAHLISTTPRTLSASTVCCNDAVFADAGLQAQEAFESRNEDFVISCPEFDQTAPNVEEGECVGHHARTHAAHPGTPPPPTATPFRSPPTVLA